LNAHVLGSKNQGRKGLISYKTENGSSTMKKIVKLKIITFKKCMLMRLYNNNVLLKQMPMRNKAPRFEKL
jgi:hypothetical protein